MNPPPPHAIYYRCLYLLDPDTIVPPTSPLSPTLSPQYSHLGPGPSYSALEEGFNLSVPGSPTLSLRSEDLYGEGEGVDEDVNMGPNTRLDTEVDTSTGTGGKGKGKERWCDAAMTTATNAKRRTGSEEEEGRREWARTHGEGQEGLPDEEGYWTHELDHRVRDDRDGQGRRDQDGQKDRDWDRDRVKDRDDGDRTSGLSTGSGVEGPVLDLMPTSTSGRMSITEVASDATGPGETAGITAAADTPRSGSGLGLVQEASGREEGEDHGDESCPCSVNVNEIVSAKENTQDLDTGAETELNSGSGEEFAFSISSSSTKSGKDHSSQLRSQSQTRSRETSRTPKETMGEEEKNLGQSSQVVDGLTSNINVDSEPTPLIVKPLSKSQPRNQRRPRPRAHLPALEIAAIQALSARTNVLPVIARADILGVKRLKEVKDVIRRDLASAGIGFGIFDGFDGVESGDEIIEGADMVAEEITQHGKKSEELIEEVKMEVIEDVSSVAAPGGSDVIRDVEMEDNGNTTQVNASLPPQPVENLDNTKVVRSKVPCLPHAVMSPDTYSYDDEEDELERKEESILREWLRVLDDALVLAASAGESKQESKKELGEVRKGLKGWMRRMDEDGERLVERYLPRLTTDRSTLVSTNGEKEATEAKFVKKFRWGVVDISNPDHCDFNPLKRAVFYHMEVCFVNNISF